jgi:predicted metal-dependent RNase
VTKPDEISVVSRKVANQAADLLQKVAEGQPIMSSEAQSVARTLRKQANPRKKVLADLMRHRD